MTKNNIEKELQDLALMLSVNCVRNTIIEEYHGGIYPSSKTGDYSDVKVVTPHGEIAWNDLARIRDEEMKAFNMEVADKVYTFLQLVFNPNQSEEDRTAYMKMISLSYPYDWNKPQMNKSILKGIEIAKGKK